MPKRNYCDITPDVIGPDIIDSVFDRIFAAARKTGIEMDSPTHKLLKRLKMEVLTGVAEGERKMSATEFTLDDAVDAFDLKYDPFSILSHWNIHEFPAAMNFSQSPCIGKVLLYLILRNGN
jgi:hypothetical protein